MNSPPPRPPGSPSAPFASRPAGEECLSWGRYPRVAQKATIASWRDEVSGILSRVKGTILTQGLRRSYGDSCLNDGHEVLLASGVNRVISFDRACGVLRVEAGASLREILSLIVPAGWFLPVSPGTCFVTIGGAIANDIHGKNHHRAGTFGVYVRGLTLQRSDGTRVWCSPHECPDLFAATIGGLGLTGTILEAEIQLKAIESPYIDVEEIQFRSLDEFRQLSVESAERFEYTVAWIDCVSQGKNFARGVFMRGNHALRAEVPGTLSLAVGAPHGRISIPLDLPPWVLNSDAVRLFNGLYFHKQGIGRRRRLVPYGPFFYPLDAVLHWNRLYGKDGFFQFQCALPGDREGKHIRDLFSMVVRSGQASFLAVIKEFGDRPSPGMLSFPRPGTTLCLDFANRGSDSVSLYKRLERFVIDHGGALYAAKDALMDGDSFERAYPRVHEFERFRDPKFSSSFWRRVSASWAAKSIL